MSQRRNESNRGDGTVERDREVVKALQSAWGERGQRICQVVVSTKRPSRGRMSLLDGVVLPRLAGCVTGASFLS